MLKKQIALVVFVILWIITAFLVAARITDLIGWSWGLILAPLWVPSAIAFVVFLISLLLWIIAERKHSYPVEYKMKQKFYNKR